jgi:hypothetical protein
MSTRDQFFAGLRWWGYFWLFLEFNTNLSRNGWIWRVVIESITTRTDIPIFRINTVGICITLMRFWISTLIVATNSTRPIFWPFVVVRVLAFTFIAPRRIDTLGISVAVIQIWRLAFVNNVVANSARLRRVFVVISVAAFALIAIFLINTVGEPAAVVQRGVGAFIDFQEAFASGSVLVRRLVDSVDWTATSVAFGLVFAHGDGITIVQASIEALVHLFHANSTRAVVSVGALIDVSISASTSIAVFVLRFTADSSGMAIIAAGVKTNRFGEYTDSSGLVLHIR